MRCALLAFTVLAIAAPVLAHAEDMVASNPTGIMCRDEKSLAEFTGPDGSVKPSVMAVPFSDISKRYMNACKGSGGGITVHVLSKRKNTSVVTYNGETWYVPNIDFITPAPDCLKDGAKVTFTGKIDSAFARTDEVDPKKGYRYPRLTLDKPVCYLGNAAEAAGRYVSLPTTSQAGAAALSKAVGQHVAITGVLTSPETSHQPPDNMMMFDPVVRPAP